MRILGGNHLRRCNGLLASISILRLQAVFLDETEQAPPIDPQGFGGAVAIPVLTVEHSLHVKPLAFFQVVSVFDGQVIKGVRRLVRYLMRQLLRRDVVSVGQDARPLDNVVEFTDVARP